MTESGQTGISEYLRSRVGASYGKFDDPTISEIVLRFLFLTEDELWL